jgi:hypothetical protein
MPADIDGRAQRVKTEAKELLHLVLQFFTTVEEMASKAGFARTDMDVIFSGPSMVNLHKQLIRSLERCEDVNFSQGILKSLHPLEDQFMPGTWRFLFLNVGKIFGKWVDEWKTHVGFFPSGFAMCKDCKETMPSQFTCSKCNPGACSHCGSQHGQPLQKQQKQLTSAELAFRPKQRMDGTPIDWSKEKAEEKQRPPQYNHCGGQHEGACRYKGLKHPNFNPDSRVLYLDSVEGRKVYQALNRTRLHPSKEVAKDGKVYDWKPPFEGERGGDHSNPKKRDGSSDQVCQPTFHYIASDTSQFCI